MHRFRATIKVARQRKVAIATVTSSEYQAAVQRANAPVLTQPSLR